MHGATGGGTRPRLGLVTIGQAPRTDLIPDVEAALSGVDWVEHGALDLLDEEGIARLEPRDGERTLVSRLRDGSRVRLGATSIAPALDDAIRRCVADRCAAVLVLCTGRVEHGPAAVPVLHAEDLAHDLVAGLVDTGRLGVLCPVPEQLTDIRERWEGRLGRPVVAAAVDPYTAGPDEVAAAGREVAAGGAELVFLDCIGYTGQQRDVLAAEGVRAETARHLAVAGAVDRVLSRSHADHARVAGG
ncbi:AroM family protein [Micromonospora inyonensis]|uniref:Protein AroM n=1 Tax=Micromonospora inyonensis TaxID=47866 RepID=A0A1C6S8D1_9ACTN|nr:AroM family protein [Micromonospora inyonensis]SCL25754.1 protein AroM [Micromonospora inyonensis]